MPDHLLYLQLYVLPQTFGQFPMEFGSVNFGVCLINITLSLSIPLSLSVPNRHLPGLLTYSNG